jgi:Na+-transporting NADH:ubiquinone oxidoreductase subunit C
MKKRLYSIVFMFVLTFVFAAVVSAVKVHNEERIQINQQVKLQRVILKVLGVPVDEKAPNRVVIQAFERRVKAIEVKQQTLYVGYGEGGKQITGYAFPVGGAGFWGPVYGMVSVDPEASRIMGIAFYRHSETPGLGARITEIWFTKQFAGLPIFPVEGDKKIFFLKPAGPGKGPNELDAITGATGTSRAVEAFVNRDLDRFLREMWKQVKKG